MALANATFSEILDDLRFIINVPEEELASVERICFQIEQAHWFYEDFVREQNSSLPINFLDWNALFKHCPLLHQWSHKHEKAFADFMQYKIRVPVCGAIMLNEKMDMCVLVKGWSSRSGWGFPKGKINKDEPDSTCAARETGYDISPLIKEQDYVELTIREQRIRLYIVVGVFEDTKFCPKTLADLPTWVRSRDKDTPYHCGGGCVKYGSSRFYMVVPFVSKLRHWLKMQRKMVRKRNIGNLQLEESEAEIFNGNTNATGQKETSPETSVPGTESEGSPPEKFQHLNSEHFKQSSSNNHDNSQNMMRSVLGLDSSQIYNPQNSQKGKDIDIGLTYDNNLAYTNNGFDHPYSYFSTSLPLGHSSHSPLTSNAQFDTSIIGMHSSNHLSNYNSIPGMRQQDNSIVFEKSTTFNSRTKSSVNQIYLNNTQLSSSPVLPIDKRDVTDITAPKPIHANTNVAVAALDPEQPLRRNSLLSLFAASTSTRKESSIQSKSIDDDIQRKNSLLSVLKSETPVSDGGHKISLTHEDILQHQRQQHSLFHYPPKSYNSVNSLENESNGDNQDQDQDNDGVFTMFQNSITQGNALFSTPTSDQNNDSTSTLNRRGSAFSRHSNQDILIQKLPINIGHIGQGRPSSNNDNINPEIHEVTRKMSLLGLCHTDYSSNDTNNSKGSPNSVEISPNHPNHKGQQNTFFSTPVVDYEHTPNSNNASGTPNSYNEPLIRLITPSPSGNNFHPKVYYSGGTEINNQEINILDLLNVNPPDGDFVDLNVNDGEINSYSNPRGGIESSILQKKEFSSNGGYEGALSMVETSSLDQRVRHKFFDPIHALIPSNGARNPMNGFKFDVEKITAAL
ncbi:6545_t:CDS:2 [Diversispora eburnea]|uniref:6545_t:CDS:1 n=1 Tax=Diversispora eburnea TaxID=1213867 RepID=A0A9N8V6S9_9GLOM|nr:6545_t:CDS:2 [Diversispora eburnea]